MLKDILKSGANGSATVNNEQLSSVKQELEKSIQSNMKMNQDKLIAIQKMDQQAFEKKIFYLNQEVISLKHEASKIKEQLDETTKVIQFDINQMKDTLKFEYQDFFENRRKIKQDINYDYQRT